MASLSIDILHIDISQAQISDVGLGLVSPEADPRMRIWMWVSLCWKWPRETPVEEWGVRKGRNPMEGV